MVIWKNDNLKRWNALLIVTEKDCKDINEGTHNPSDLLPFPEKEEDNDGVSENRNGVVKILKELDPNINFIINNKWKKPILENRIEGSHKPSNLIPLPQKEEENDGVNKNRNRVVNKLKKVNPKTIFITNNKWKKPIFEAEPPMMPMNMLTMVVSEIGGKDIRWLNNKSITKTDVNPKECRLCLPTDELQEVLTEREKLYLKVQTTNVIEVCVVGPRNEVWDMTMRYWPSSRKCVLTKNWLVFAEKNEVQAKVDIVEIWSFRKGSNGQLGFAFNVRRIADFQRRSTSSYAE